MLWIFGSLHKKRPKDDYAMNEARFRELKCKHFIRLFTSYMVPFKILTIYLYKSYRDVDKENQRLHLVAIAKSQANT